MQCPSQYRCVHISNNCTDFYPLDDYQSVVLCSIQHDSPFRLFIQKYSDSLIEPKFVVAFVLVACTRVEPIRHRDPITTNGRVVHCNERARFTRMPPQFCQEMFTCCVQSVYQQKVCFPDRLHLYCVCLHQAYSGFAFLEIFIVIEHLYQFLRNLDVDCNNRIRFGRQPCRKGVPRSAAKLSDTFHSSAKSCQCFHVLLNVPRVTLFFVEVLPQSALAALCSTHICWELVWLGWDGSSVTQSELRKSKWS